MDRPKRSNRNEKPVYVFRKIDDFKRETDTPSVASLVSEASAKPKRKRKSPEYKELSYAAKLKLYHPLSTLELIARTLEQVALELQSIDMAVYGKIGFRKDTESVLEAVGTSKCASINHPETWDNVGTKDGGKRKYKKKKK